MTASLVIRKLEKSDNRKNFNCGNEELNLFFHRYAGQNQFRNYIGVSYVAVQDDRILAYATVSPGQLDADLLPNKKKLPQYPIPVLRIARLAVIKDLHQAGIGKQLLRYCLELAEKMRDEFGCVGILVDAKQSAVSYYEQFGFGPVELVEGLSPGVPKQTPMFLALSSVPARKRK